MKPNAKRLAALSIATAVVAAGAPASAGAAANSDEASADGVISSYLGPLGLRDDFNKYLAEQVRKAGEKPVEYISGFLRENNLQPPPGIEN